MTRLSLLFLSILILLGQPVPLQAQDSLFAAGVPVTVGDGSGDVRLIDINGDGYLDLLTCHLLERMVTVQLGDGKGSFAKTPDSPLRFEFEPGGIDVGDIDNDGFLDLAVRQTDRDIVHVLRGNGSGGFSPVSGSPFAANNIDYLYTKPSLHLHDVNEDGNLDVILANGRHSTFSTLLGDGQGGFTKGRVTRLGFGQSYYSVAFGDVNSDGYLDVVSAQSGAGDNSNVGRVLTKFGDGTGAFKSKAIPVIFVSAGPQVGALADVNGDQHLDVVLSHDDSNHVSVLFNNGSGLFVSAPTSPYPLQKPAFAIVVGDANADQKADILAATVSSRTAPYRSDVAVLLSNSNGFTAAPGSPFPTGSGAYNLTAGDVNEDGKLDVVASSFEGNAVTLLLGQ